MRETLKTSLAKIRLTEHVIDSYLNEPCGLNSNTMGGKGSESVEDKKVDLARENRLLSGAT